MSYGRSTQRNFFFRGLYSFTRIFTAINQINNRTYDQRIDNTNNLRHEKFFLAIRQGGGWLC